MVQVFGDFVNGPAFSQRCSAALFTGRCTSPQMQLRTRLGKEKGRRSYPTATAKDSSE
jgi:hypothetical protein